MFVSFVDTTEFYNQHLFLLSFHFDFFCFLLHYNLGLALTDQVTSALLPSHHALIMVCFWSPVATSQQVRGTNRLSKLIYNQIPRTSRSSFLPRDKLRGDLTMDQLRRNATSWTSVSISLLILECWSCLQVVLQRVAKKAHPLTEIFIGWRPFRIRMWSSAAIQLYIWLLHRSLASLS